MTDNTPHRIWTQPKFNVYFNVVLICAVNLIGLVITILFWQELNIAYKSVLLTSFFLAIPFLMIKVLGITVDKNTIVFILPHKKTSMNLAEIKSARLIKKMSNEYLEIRTTKSIGFRKQFRFLVKKNEEAVAEIMNEFLNNGVKVYSNSNLETSVNFNSATNTFECV
ncbi:MAG: hypothetical protein QNK23_09195 [Crocinitomicaceae bacterium]|nr:hypothetical protein [Crocinitomicaceae bacterium]